MYNEKLCVRVLEEMASIHFADDLADIIVKSTENVELCESKTIHAIRSWMIKVDLVDEKTEVVHISNRKKQYCQYLARPLWGPLKIASDV